MPKTSVRVKVKRLETGKDLPLPQYQTEDSVGLDLHAAVPGETIIAPRQILAIPCGISIEVPLGFEAQVRSRSGLVAEYGIAVANSPGTIDPDYRGEIMVLLINHGNQPFAVTRRMRIAQLLVAPVPHVEWEEVEDLDSTGRAKGGFGYTGL